MEKNVAKKSGDHRKRVTKMLIRQAFTALLSQKPIQSISIKELCALAGLNRGTFYANYADIYDLLHQIEDEMMEELQRIILPLLPTNQSAIPEGRTLPAIVSTEIFRCLKDNSDLCIVTLGEYGDKDFAVRLIEMGRRLCVGSYMDYFEHATRKQVEYFYVFASNGCLGLLRKWLEDGLKESPEQMAEIAENLMMQGIRFLLAEDA